MLMVVVFVTVTPSAALEARVISYAGQVMDMGVASGKSGKMRVQGGSQEISAVSLVHRSGLMYMLFPPPSLPLSPGYKSVAPVSLSRYRMRITVSSSPC